MALVSKGWFRSYETPFQMASPLRNSRSALCARLQMVITSSFQLQIMYHLNHWTPDFSRFKTTYGMHNLSSKKCSKNVSNSCKMGCGCDISAHCLHSRLQTAITSSFHLQIVYRFKRWTPDFTSFKTRYSMHNLRFRKCSKMCPIGVRLQHFRS